ncbi:conjugal transfer protein TrbL [Myceligenerans crystallogenes]|uniref:TrbL/VirB6 plasmid conjugal transfer protein n=1 Tax=Myceligenerans crystallogenes TaxID=316335 RepID=A0ABP4ZZ18_9MICO
MICDDPIAATVCQEAADQATSVAFGVFEDLADGVGGVAEFLIKGLWTVMDSTTSVDLSTERFGRVYGLTFGIAVFLMLAFFLFQLITAMLHREPGALARALSGLAKSVLGSFVVVMLTGLLLEIVDHVCLALVAAAGTSMDEMGGQLAALAAVGVTGSIVAPQTGALLNLFLSGLVVGAALITWFSLLMRKALLLIAIALAPIALAGASWDATRSWVARWAQFVIALIVSKLVIVVIFLLATTMTASPVAADLATWTDKLSGVTLLLVAGFAPYLAYKAIAWMGFDMYHAMSIEQESKAALNRPVALRAAPSARVEPGQREVQKILPSGGGGDGGTARAGTGPGGGPGGRPSGGRGLPAGAPVTAGGGTAAGSQAGAAGGKAAATKAAAVGGAGAVTAGVAIPLIVATEAAKAATTAGPKAGAAMGSAAVQQADQGAPTGSDAPRPAGARRAGARPAPSGPPAAAPTRAVPAVVTNRSAER